MIKNIPPALWFEKIGLGIIQLVYYLVEGIFFIRRKKSITSGVYTCLTYQSIIPMHDTESAFTCIRTISFSCSSSRKNDWFTLFEK